MCAMTYVHCPHALTPHEPYPSPLHRRRPAS
ncbi:hypothetical protein OV450_1121 [Actinobacteria bacterium OV450]|nr:hypothetical protein OV450_1121 [Actinobacteria bacterium OV450]